MISSRSQLIYLDFLKAVKFEVVVYHSFFWFLKFIELPLPRKIIAKGQKGTRKSEMT